MEFPSGDCGQLIARMPRIVRRKQIGEIWEKSGEKLAIKVRRHSEKSTRKASARKKELSLSHKLSNPSGLTALA